MDDFREHGLFLMYNVSIFYVLLVCAAALWSGELRMHCTLDNKFENSTDFCNITVVDLKINALFLFQSIFRGQMFPFHLMNRI